MMKFKQSLCLVLSVAMVGLASPRPVHADQTETDVGIAMGVMAGVGLLAIGGFALAFSGKNFEGHVKNERGSPQYAKNELDSELKQAFASPGEHQPTVSADAPGFKIVPTAGYLPGHGTAPGTAVGGVTGVF